MPATPRPEFTEALRNVCTHYFKLGQFEVPTKTIADGTGFNVGSVEYRLEHTYKLAPSRYEIINPKQHKKFWDVREILEKL